MKSEQSEADVRDQLENALARTRQADQKTRQKDEESFQIARENQTMSRDLKNMRDVEAQLKSEIQTINGQRVHLEDLIQDLKQNVSQS